MLCPFTLYFSLSLAIAMVNASHTYCNFIRELMLQPTTLREQRSFTTASLPESRYRWCRLRKRDLFPARQNHASVNYQRVAAYGCCWSLPCIFCSGVRANLVPLSAFTPCYDWQDNSIHLMLFSSFYCYRFSSNFRKYPLPIQASPDAEGLFYLF